MSRKLQCSENSDEKLNLQDWLENTTRGRVKVVKTHEYLFILANFETLNSQIPYLTRDWKDPQNRVRGSFDLGAHRNGNKLFILPALLNLLLNGPKGTALKDLRN